MKCALIAFVVFLFIVFGAGTPFIVYRNTGASETVPDTNGTLPETNSTVPDTSSTEPALNGTTTTNSTSLSGVPTRRALAACPQTGADALLLGDGTFICTYASGACTYDSETGELLDDQSGGSCPKEANVKDRARKSRRGLRYEAIAKRVLE